MMKLSSTARRAAELMTAVTLGTDVVTDVVTVIDRSIETRPHGLASVFFQIGGTVAGPGQPQPFPTPSIGLSIVGAAKSDEKIRFCALRARQVGLRSVLLP